MAAGENRFCEVLLCKARGEVSVLKRHTCRLLVHQDDNMRVRRVHTRNLQRKGILTESLCLWPLP